MMVDRLRQPLRVIVLDFGLVFNHLEEWTGANLQSRWYRSSEVLLGAPFTEAIDGLWLHRRRNAYGHHHVPWL
ncbi:hypothetical protein VZT92_014594 [Zoarces viviparus]|uniref:MHC class I antigen n=1 Tax=Zoarces viviparus TaxID=48416 RepID=A0AAW1F0K3_ZOAVI